MSERTIVALRGARARGRAIGVPRTCNVGHQCVFGLFLSLLVASAACQDRASEIRQGVKEPRVREVLGEPSWVVTEPTDVRSDLVGDDRCAKAVVKVLVYDRAWFRDDVFVGVNSQGVVECKLGGQVLKRGP